MSRTKRDVALGEFLVLRSVPLRRLDADGRPNGMASACLVEHLGSRWILSVSHAVGDAGNWAVECEFDEERQATKLYQLGPMNLAAVKVLGGGHARELDLAYVKVPADLTPRWQPSDDAGNRIKDLPRELSFLSFDVPQREVMYGFAGNVKGSQEAHLGRLYFATEQVAYHGLRYIGTDADFDVFEFPFDRPADEWLCGTSGSPILDDEGRVHALVCRAGSEPSTIEGIGVRYFRPLLEISAQVG